MDACTVEVGLLRKHPCGSPSVAKCANCEQPLCTKHAIAQHSPTGAKTGKFMCTPCDAAAKLYEQTEPAPAAVKKPPEAPRPAAAPKPPTPKPAAAKPEPVEDSGPLEFTPGKPPEPKPGEKK